MKHGLLKIGIPLGTLKKITCDFCNKKIEEADTVPVAKEHMCIDCQDSTGYGFDHH